MDYNLIKRVITSFNNLHFDVDTGVMHSIPSARVHELRGRVKHLLLSEDESSDLVTAAAAISAENSLLDILLVQFINYQETRKKGQKTYKSLHKYICTVLHDPNQLKIIDQLVINYSEYTLISLIIIRQMKED